MYTRILVPTDGSQLSERALREAGELARATGGTLTLFYAAPAYRMPTASFEGAMVQNVITPERYRRTMRAHARRLLDGASRKTGGTVTRRVCEFSDQPYEAIIAAAKK